MSLSTTALLITLKLSTFSPRRKDPRITADVLRKHSVTSNDLGAWSTTLLPAHATNPITNLAQRIRKHHTQTVLPWDRDGTGLLPGLKFFDYTSTSSDFRIEWDAAVNTFVQNYPAYLNEAKQTLNGLFNPDLYPYPSEVRSKFSFIVQPEPVPVADDLRISLSDSERQQLQSQMEERLQQATEAAQKELLHRIAQPISKLVNSLANPDAPIREGHLTRLHEVLKDVEAYNLTSDPQISALKTEILQQLGTYSADSLSSHQVLRQAAADKAQAILQKMAAWGTP